MTQPIQKWQEILKESKREIGAFRSYLATNPQDKAFREQLTTALSVLANEEGDSEYDSRQNSQYLVAHALVEYGADIDPDNTGIVWEAAQNGHFHLLEGMLDSAVYSKGLQEKVANKAYRGAASRLQGDVLSLLDGQYDIDHSADDHAAWRLANEAIERAGRQKASVDASGNDAAEGGGLLKHYVKASNVVNVTGPDVLEYLDGIGAKPAPEDNVVIGQDYS